MIDCGNWRTKAPGLFKFDWTDPTARLVAADYVQECGDEALAAWLRALPPIVPPAPGRAADQQRLLADWSRDGSFWIEVPADPGPGVHPGGLCLAAYRYRNGRDEPVQWAARCASLPGFTETGVPRSQVYAAGSREEAAFVLVLALRGLHATRARRGIYLDPALALAGRSFVETVTSPTGSGAVRPAYWRESW